MMVSRVAQVRASRRFLKLYRLGGGQDRMTTSIDYDAAVVLDLLHD